MADVQPFRGLRYNLQRIGDLSAVISPPYDVISPGEQSFYYQRSPHNIIRLEFGEERPGDSADNNKYTRAAATMDGWLRQGILIREQRPAFYLIEHRFPYQDNMKSRWGLTARVRLEDLGQGQIRPHELTMKKPAVDRLHLLQSCRVNLSPIMVMFRHQKGSLPSLFPTLITSAPALSAADSYGVTYNVWVVTDEEATARVSRLFANKALYIIDGHHRYETALTYQREQCASYSSGTGNEAFNFVMMTLADSEGPGLIVLPTHRLVRGLGRERLGQLLEPSYLQVEKLLPPRATLSETLNDWLDALGEQRPGKRIFGLYGLHGEHLCLVSVRQQAIEEGIALAGMPAPWKDLDVGLLHGLVLRGILGIDSPEKEGRHLEYTRDGLEAVSRVDAGECQLAFFLNPVSVSSVMALADLGIRMPQKSTFFYPKTPAGLVINPVSDDV